MSNTAYCDEVPGLDMCQIQPTVMYKINGDTGKINSILDLWRIWNKNAGQLLHNPFAVHFLLD